VSCIAAGEIQAIRHGTSATFRTNVIGL
jgi:hypothetical protein